MALKFEIDSLDGLDSSIHSQYVKTDTGYRLDIDGLEDTNGLKTALVKERESNKEAKQKLAELEKLRDEAERKTLEEQGKYKDLSERERNDKIQAQSKFAELQKKVAEKTRDIMVRDLAQSMTTDSIELDIIVKFSSDFVTIDGEDVEFSKPIEEIKSEMSKFVRSKASGTDDGGNNKGDGSVTTVTREQFDKMSPYVKSKFTKDGGKIK